MFLECKSYDDYWALTKNDLYHLKEDDDFVFEEYNGEGPEDE